MFIELTDNSGMKFDVNTDKIETITPLNESDRSEAQAKLKLGFNFWVKVMETRSEIQNLINRSFK